MQALFISDLHLHEERPQLTRAFLHFLACDARQCDQLYILGDLFESWIGDDDDTPLHQQCIRALAQLSRSGVGLFIQHGNRDFLLGEQFAEQTGARLLPEHHQIDLGLGPVLLMHGDTLCTDDHDYLAFRQQVRQPLWQQQLLQQPLTARRQLAAQLRQKSRQAQLEKSYAIMDANADAVADAMRQAGVTTLIHGHTHRPARHRFVLDGQPAQRLVLGDWDQQLWWIRSDQGVLSLQSRALG